MNEDVKNTTTDTEMTEVQVDSKMSGKAKLIVAIIIIALLIIGMFTHNPPYI